MNKLALRLAESILPENFSWEECVTANHSLVSPYDSDELYQRVIVFYHILYEFDYPASTLYAHWMFCKETDDEFERLLTIESGNLSEVIAERGYEPNPSILTDIKELRKSGLVPHYKRRVNTC